MVALSTSVMFLVAPESPDKWSAAGTRWLGVPGILGVLTMMSLFREGVDTTTLGEARFIRIVCEYLRL